MFTIVKRLTANYLSLKIVDKTVSGVATAWDDSSPNGKSVQDYTDEDILLAADELNVLPRICCTRRAVLGVARQNLSYNI